MYLKDVPKDAAERMAGRPFVAFSLLQHEHKKSVVHFTVQRNTEYEETVRSKVSKCLFLSVPVVVTAARIPSYSVWDHDDYELGLYTASTRRADPGASTTYTNSHDTFDTVRPTWPLFTRQSYSAINLVHC